MLKWLRAKGCPWDVSACAQAALGGHLEVLKWRAEKCPWSKRMPVEHTETSAMAASSGHMDVLEWLKD